MECLTKEYNRRFMQGDRDGLKLAWIEKAVDDAPTVDAIPVRHGRWVEWPECAKYAEAYSEDHIACSVCGHVFNVLDNNCEEFKYCPNCGACMRGDE